MEGAWEQGAMRIGYNNNLPQRKKCPKSPFIFFCLDQRENLAAQGHRVQTMAELTAAAHQSWMDLQNDPIRLEKYMEMNRDWNMRNKYDLENKFDSLGRPLAHIEREAKKKQMEKQEENRNIEKTVEIGMKRGDLAQKKFYIAYFNTLCKTQEGFHIPCEAGIVEYSVEGGVERGFHEFLSPITIPMGYKFTCLKKSRETHNIPPDVDDFELYVGDYRKIFAVISNFLTGGDDSAELPPLYVMPDQTEAAQYITKFITEEANADKRLVVYQLPKLLYELRNAAPDVDVEKIRRVRRGEESQPLKWIPSVAVAEMLLEKEPYAYWRGLGCDFHEALDNTNFCALAKAKGLAYHVADICSHPFNVTMKPNRHAPQESEIRDFDERMKDESGFFTCVTKAKQIIAKATTMEWVNPWGTKISIHAAPAGVTNIPNQFDPNSVEVGYGAEQFPGLHPEIDTSSEFSFEAGAAGAAGAYGGENLVNHGEGSSYTGNVLFSLSDDEEVESVKSFVSTTSSVKYGGNTSSVKYGENTSSVKYGGNNSSVKYGENNSNVKYGENNSSFKYGEKNSSVKYGENNSSFKYGENNSSVKYGESRLAGLFSQEPGRMILPSLSDPNKGSQHPLTNRPGATQAGPRNASSHLEISGRREGSARGVLSLRGRSRGGRGRRDYKEETFPQGE